MKRERVVHGQIRVCGTARGISYPKVQGWTVIPAWSRGANPFNQLSPFNIGPIEYEGIIAENFECFWQSFKVWKYVVQQISPEWSWPKEIHLDETTNEPTKEWYMWHKALLQNKRPVRRPNGREIPAFAWFKGEKLDVVQARKQIYIPFLQKLYRANKVYRDLLERVQNGENLIIVEPDGPLPNLFPEGLDVTIDMLQQLQDVCKVKDMPNVKSASEKYTPYGHGYVIALTLLEDLAKE